MLLLINYSAESSFAEVAGSVGMGPIHHTLCQLTVIGSDPARNGPAPLSYFTIPLLPPPPLAIQHALCQAGKAGAGWVVLEWSERECIICMYEVR